MVKPRLGVILLFALAFVVGIILIAGGGGGSEDHVMLDGRSLPLGDTPVISTEDVVAGRYYARGANCSWVSEHHLTWVSSSGDLVLYNVQDGEKSVVVSATQFISRPWKVRFANDRNLVLVGFEPRRLFRSTILARYAVYDGSSGELVHELRPGGDASGTVPQPLQLAVWSNDNRTVLSVHKNDVYAVRVNGKDGAVVNRLTSDGSEVVFNGIADWVYEEEVFTSTSTSVFSSLTGSHVAYLKFNDSGVSPISYNLYGDYSSEPFSPYFLYPRQGTVRYPKAGTRNPTVSIHVVRLGDDACWTGTANDCLWDFELNSLMDKLVGGGKKSKHAYILGSLRWLDSDSVFIMNVFNRVQNVSWLLECSVDKRNCGVIRDGSLSNGWIDTVPVLPYKSEYVSLSSVGQHDGLSYMHVSAVTRDRVRFLTRGTFSVDEVVGIYYIGGSDVLIFKSPLLRTKDLTASLQDSTQSHYYGVDLAKPFTSPVCLTCSGGCTFNSAKFSGDGAYFVQTCEREANVSRVEVKGISDQLNVTSKLVLEVNKGLMTALEGISLPSVTFRTVPYKLKGKTYNFNVKLIGPVGWEKGRDRQFPLVVDVYGGPNSQKVTRKFTPGDWSYALASNPHWPVVYVVIDGIGSGRQSSSLAFEVYRDLGNKEVVDKIHVVKELLANHSSLDAERTLIWGWSYGGYLTSMLLGKDKERVLKCGIAVAPVVNWHFYDTIYTERYMGTPDENIGGYNTSNVIQYVDEFEGKPFLLVHGNADDNVHYQQSMVLSRALEQRGILFRMQSYPDENHSLGGVRPHLFRTLEEFVFNQCFGGVGGK